jgi:RNA polymerase sigma factor (sigma-70 family)
MGDPGRASAGAVREFEAQRRRLLGLAYRLLGSASEAEDAVQDAFLRWHATDRARVASPSAWLTKAVTNLCLTRLASARARREAYVGPWLPEPVLAVEEALGPLETAELRESVSHALLVLLERLAPAERAVFVLAEAFTYSHREIAEILEISEANSRQLHHRARQRLAQARRRFRVSRAQRHRILERFLSAARTGDLDGLERLLAAEVHGDQAILVRVDGRLRAVTVPNVTQGRIGALHPVLDPDKLAFLVGRLSHRGWLPGPPR